jgi:hypothetical protein
MASTKISMKNLLLIPVFFISCFLSCSKKYKSKVVELTLIETAEERALKKFWRDFSVRFDSKDTALIKAIVLDTVWLWDKKVSSKEFLSRYTKGYTSSDISGILDTNRVIYGSIGCTPYLPVKDAIKRFDSDACNCSEILVVRDSAGPLVYGAEFTFLETLTGYRLLGIKHASRYWRFDDNNADTIPFPTSLRRSVLH